MPQGQTNTLDPDGELIDRQGLETAFRDFSSISSQLIDSYELLQNQVEDLKGKLSKSNRERVQVGRDREDIANRLEHLLDFLPGGVVVIDSSGVIEDCNPVAMDFLGSMIVGQSWPNVIKHNFSPRLDDGHEISLKDGRRLSIATRSMNDDAFKKGQIVLLTDQTETRELQDQLSRHDRMSTMGKMVAYLAHQIRTPLSSAMLYGGHLENSELTQEQRSSFSGKLLSQLKNVERQISDLLIFAKGEHSTQEEIELKSFFYLLKREIEANANLQDLNIIYQNDAPKIAFFCNSPSLISAILNLVNNAREAGLEFNPKHHTKIVIKAIVIKHKLLISVSDNGPGISKNQMAQVLEPFYSTKSKGTGLGLAVVQAVTKSLGGTLSMQAVKTGGVKMKLSIPLA